MRAKKKCRVIVMNLYRQFLNDVSLLKIIIVVNNVT